MKQKIYNLFDKIDADNPLELAREIVAPLCMNKMNEMILNCKDCKTVSDYKSIAKGNPNANIMIINDVATNSEEVNEYLYTLLEAADIDKNDVFIINAVSCVCQRKIKNEYVDRLPSIEEAKNCKYFLDHAIQFVRPRAIISMGATALTMYQGQYSLQDAKCTYQNFNGIKTMITYSVKDIFDFAEYKSESESQEIADEVLGCMISVKEYIDSIMED